LTISVQGKDPVTIGGSAVSVLQGQTVSQTAATGVLANASDVDGDPIKVTAVGGKAALIGQAVAGTYGTLTLNADGSYTYVTNAVTSPGQGAIGNDVFRFTVADSNGATRSTTLTVSVQGTGSSSGAAAASIIGLLSSAAPTNGAGDGALPPISTIDFEDNVSSYMLAETADEAPGSFLSFGPDGGPLLHQYAFVAMPKITTLGDLCALGGTAAAGEEDDTFAFDDITGELIRLNAPVAALSSPSGLA
jgi:VCBS repeat-containing protein